MSRFGVTINHEFSATRMTPRVGATGRRVRDISAFIAHNEHRQPLNRVTRGVASALSRLMLILLWIGCFFAGALGCLIWRFY